MSYIARSIVSIVVLMMTFAAPAGSQGVPGISPNKCLTGKTKCVDKKVAGLLKCREKCQKDPAKCGTVQGDCEAKVIAKFDGGTKGVEKSCFEKLEASNDGPCVTFDDLATMEAKVDTFVGDVVMTLEDIPHVRCGFPATGQTTCWDETGTVIPCAGTGHDGDTHAGAPLAYVDNGDGTITDVNTGLMWEKLSWDGSVHDYSNVYTWANAFAGHVAPLNAGGGFAGHTDWRVPNYKELVSILNLQNAGPAVSAAFNTACAPGCTVLTCSCTASFLYWSSTSLATTPWTPWVVNFLDGYVQGASTSFNIFVRAVRSGP
jgi:hypothetical protein